LSRHPELADLSLTDDRLAVVLADGREVAAPLAWSLAFSKRLTLSDATGDSSGGAMVFTGRT
jgi:hypothetical protein